MVGLAGNLNLLGGHLAQNSDGNASWKWSVLVQDGWKQSSGLSYGQGKDAIGTQSAETATGETRVRGHTLITSSSRIPRARPSAAGSLVSCLTGGGRVPEAMFDFRSATYRGPHPIRQLVSRESRHEWSTKGEQTLYKDLRGSINLRPCPLAIRAGRPPLETRVSIPSAPIWDDAPG